MYYLLLFLPFVIGISKEFEAPVARRDADMEVFSFEKTSIISDQRSEIMCAVYLCPSLPDHATSYIQEGCIGDFKEWVSIIHQKEDKTMFLEEESSATPSLCISPETLILLILCSTTLSFIIGWREYSFQQKIYRVKIDQMD